MRVVCSFKVYSKVIVYMPKLYLLGGENVFKRSAKEVNEKAFRDAGESPAVAVFPWARASFDRKYAKRKILTDYLISLGAATINFLEYQIRMR